MEEREEEPKSILMKVEEESEKHGLKLNIQKTKFMASGLITSWWIDGETMETVTDFIFLGSEINADGDCSHEIKICLLLGRKAMTNLDTMLKRRDITLWQGPFSQSYGFPSSHVWRVWELEQKVGWTPKNWSFRLWCLRRQLRDPCTAVDPNGNQPWTFSGVLMLKLKHQYFGHLMPRADSLEKTLMLGKIAKKKDKGSTEDEMVGWYHWFNGHEF